MIRLLTAAAMVALLASPAMAQSVSPSDNSGSSSTMQNQGTTTSPGSSSSESMGTQLSPGLTPTDCLPNDPRPGCQTAQLPSQDTPSADPGASGSTTYPSERGSSGSSGSSGGMGNYNSGGSGSGSSSGTTDR